MGKDRDLSVFIKVQTSTALFYPELFIPVGKHSGKNKKIKHVKILLPARPDESYQV